MDPRTAILTWDGLTKGPVARVVVDGRGEVVLASEGAVALLGECACVPGLPLADDDLRDLAVRAAATGDTYEVAAAPLGAALVEVSIAQLGGGAGAALTYVDVTDRTELRDARRQLRDTVDELAALSEQMHVANRRLRRLSDDLGDANAELETLNDELRSRAEELAGLDGALRDAVGASARPALVADASGRVRVWTAEAEQLWSIRTEDAEGRRLSELELGTLEAALRGAARPVGEVIATDATGGEVLCETHCGRPSGWLVVFMRRARGDSAPHVLGHAGRMAPPGSHAFELRVPAVPASVGELRHALSAELETMPVPTELVDDIGLAVSEAATNAVLHAYLGESIPGPLLLSACLMDDTVHVVVRDHGRGMTPRPDSPGLGLGLPLMTRLADAVQISTHPEGGTEVRMTFTVEDDGEDGVRFSTGS